MVNMTFKSFTWYQNPEVLKISHRSVPRHTKTNGGTYVFAGMGEDQYIISGSGEFSGPGGYEHAAALEELFADITGGILKLPDGRKLQAFLTEFNYTQDARQMYVAYEFTFHATNQNGAIPK